MYPTYRKLPSEKEQENRFKRFLKSRVGQMMELRQDIEIYTMHKYNQTSFDRKSHLARAIWIATRGTKMEEDAMKILEIIVPDFFDDEQPQEDAFEKPTSVNLLDCGDHNCKYATDKSGIRTNGGCRCEPDKKSQED